MDNTIPFNPTSCTVRTEQITVDVSIRKEKQKKATAEPPFMV